MKIPRVLGAVPRGIRSLPGKLVTLALRRESAQHLLAWAMSKLPYDRSVDLKFFDFCEHYDWHALRVHYYHPVPDTRTLSDDFWNRRSEMIGVDLNTDRQLELLTELYKSFGPEFNAFPDEKTSCPWEFHYNQDSFRSADPEILYSLIRKFKPKKIIEIGSGGSTLVSAAAIRKNEELHGDMCQLTAIEPFPNDVLTRGFPGLSELIATPVQEVPLAKFAELGENDILFIDSTHVAKIGGDVLYEYLEILPRLKPGVIIHSHDIFSPADYPRDLTIEKHCFWTEQYLLQAFLTFNREFEVLWSGSYMHLNFPDRLEACFRAYDRKKEWPASFWIRRK